MLDSETFGELYQSTSHLNLAGKIARRVLKSGIRIVKNSRPDLIWVKREAAIFGPSVLEVLATRAWKVPLIVDLDDSTWIPYKSPTHGTLARMLKFPSKTNALIRRARLVTCGSNFIEDHVRNLGTPTFLIPSCLDLSCYKPKEVQPQENTPTIGWIGTHTTFPALVELFPALDQLTKYHEFQVLIVGRGNQKINVPGNINIVFRDWSLEREPGDFAALDIGLYPISPGPWAEGKSALKSVQYLACGVPFVASPVGQAREVGRESVTNFFARTPKEWYDRIEDLLVSPGLRTSMGLAGRNYACEHHDANVLAQGLAERMWEVYKKSRDD